MIDLTNSDIYSLLPPNFKDDNEVKAVCYAMDGLLETFFMKVKRTAIWSNIKGVEEDIADYLAAELRTPFYDAHLPLETKQTMVANTLPWYSKLGTKEVIEDVIKLQFGIGWITEWFELENVDPYFFRIELIDAMFTSKEFFESFIAAIYMLKNVRSWLEMIKITLNISDELYIGGAVIVDESIIRTKDKYLKDMCIHGVQYYLSGIWDISRIYIPTKKIREEVVI